MNLYYIGGYMKRIIILFFAGLFFLAAALGVLGLYGYSNLPNVKTLKGCLTTEMFKIRLCPGSESYSKLTQISPYLRQAIIISEDASFYSHAGFDLNEIKDALEKDIEKLKFSRGASTITQQLVKNVFLTKDKTIIRKIKEAYLTKKVEQSFTKDEILERYLNVIQFGKDLYGVKAAAKFYFQKEPLNLNILESSFLALLLPSPEKYSASYHKGQLTKFARARIHNIIGKLHSVGRISDGEYARAKEQMDAFPWNQIDLSSPEPSDPISDDTDDNSDDLEF